MLFKLIKVVNSLECRLIKKYFFVVVNYLILDGSRELQVGTYPDILKLVFYGIWNT